MKSGNLHLCKVLNPTVLPCVESRDEDLSTLSSPTSVFLFLIS